MGGNGWFYSVKSKSTLQTRKEILMIRKKSGPVLGCVLAALLVVALGGCATSQSGKQDESAVKTPPVTPLAKPYGEIVVYEIETTPVLKKDYEQDLMICQSTLVSSLLKRNKYRRVEAARSNETYGKPALLVKIKVSDMRIASAGARIWGGALAGSSYMNMRMVLVDAETQQVVREEDFNSTNNAFAAAWTFGASDRSLPSDMAEIMAAYIDKAVQPI
jgi:hypothetical protein